MTILSSANEILTSIRFVNINNSETTQFVSYSRTNVHQKQSQISVTNFLDENFHAKHNHADQERNQAEQEANPEMFHC